VARPLRLEVEDGIYHVTARGNERKAIYRDMTDRERFLEVLARTLERFRWSCLAYCLMTNHYHLLVRTLGRNLSRGMRDLNGIYAQAFNRRYGRDGHLFQGRYRAVLVESDEHLLSAVAYIVRNPVRAGMCSSPAEWRWSSHAGALGVRPPGMLGLAELWSCLAPTRARARALYRALTEDEAAGEIVSYEGRVLDGSDAFARRHLAGLERDPEIPPRTCACPGRRSSRCSPRPRARRWRPRTSTATRCPRSPGTSASTPRPSAAG
jgi:REP element-mobilizing transposase RayT